MVSIRLAKKTVDFDTKVKILRFKARLAYKGRRSGEAFLVVVLYKL